MSHTPRVQAIVVIIAAGIIGGAAGITFERLRDEPTQEGASRSDPRRPRTNGRRMPSVFDRLDLTDTQRERVRAVFEAYEPQTRAVMEEMFPRMRAIQDSARADIEAILTDDQRARLAEMGDFWNRRGAARRGHRSGRRGNGVADPAPPRDSQPDSIG